MKRVRKVKLQTRSQQQDDEHVAVHHCADVADQFVDHDTHTPLSLLNLSLSYGRSHGGCASRGMRLGLLYRKWLCLNRVSDRFCKNVQNRITAGAA